MKSETTFSEHGINPMRNLLRSDALLYNDEFEIFEVKYFPLPEHPFKVTAYGFVLCLEGKVTGTIDLIHYELTKGMLAVNKPGQLVAYESMSRDFRAICVVMSQRFIDRLALPYNFDVEQAITTSPVIELNNEMSHALTTYCAMVRELLREERRYQLETLKHLTCAYFYGLGSYLYTIEQQHSLSSKEQIAKRFLSYVQQHFHNERKVSFYASKLCLSSGYLSTIITEATGKTASEWIESFVVMEAKALLKSTNITIQQISDSLHFPSQSFFGKYFKRMVGVSPKEYRDGQTP